MRIEIKFMIALGALIAALVAQAHGFDLYSFGEFSHDMTRHEYGIDESEDWFNTVLGAGVNHDVWKFSLFAEVEQETYMVMINPTSYDPRHQDYYIRGGAWAGPVFLQIQHVCFHAVDERDSRQNGGHTRLTIGFDSRREW